MSDALQTIVSSYNLPKRIECLVLRIASRNITNLGLTSFNDQYRFIANLIDKFQTTHEDRNAVSLDSPIYRDGRTWHDVLPSAAVFEDEETGIPLEKAVSISDLFLGDRQKVVNHKFLEKSTSGENIQLAPDEVIADFLGIGFRSTAVANYLTGGGRLYPERKIFYVRIDPDNVYIRWGKRNYQGNPLAFFRRHEDVYGSKTRSELKDFDSGLYSSLVTATSALDDGTTVKQIELAVPTVKDTIYGDNPLKYFDEHRTRYAGLTRQELRRLNPGLYDALYDKGQLGKAIPAVRRKLSVEEVKRILDAYKLCRGNSTLVARILGEKESTVWSVWKRKGFRTMRRRKDGRPVKVL